MSSSGRVGQARMEAAPQYDARVRTQADLRDDARAAGFDGVEDALQVVHNVGAPRGHAAQEQVLVPGAVGHALLCLGEEGTRAVQREPLPCLLHALQPCGRLRRRGNPRVALLRDGLLHLLPPLALELLLQLARDVQRRSLVRRAVVGRRHGTERDARLDGGKEAGWA